MQINELIDDFTNTIDDLTSSTMNFWDGFTKEDLKIE